MERKQTPIEQYKIFLLTFAGRNGYTVNAMCINHPSSSYLSNLCSKQSAKIHLVSTASTLTCFLQTFLLFFRPYFTSFFFSKPDKTKFPYFHLKSTRFVADTTCTVCAQKLPCIQGACPIQLMSHVKWPFVLDFWTPNSLARPINFGCKYFRVKICHFNLLRKHHSFLRQGVNNT